MLDRRVLVLERVAGRLGAVEKRPQLSTERRLGAACRLREPRDRVVNPPAGRVEVHPEARQERRKEPALLGQESLAQVLGLDLGIAVPARDLLGGYERFLEPVREAVELHALRLQSPGDPATGLEGFRVHHPPRFGLDSRHGQEVETRGVPDCRSGDRAYKKDVDRASIRENLRRTPEERILNLQSLQQLATELRRAGRKLHHRP